MFWKYAYKVKKKLYINNILRGNAILSQKLNISLKLQKYLNLLSKFKIKIIKNTYYV